MAQAVSNAEKRNSENQGKKQKTIGLLIVLSGILIYNPQGWITCHITGGRAADTPGRFQKITFWISVIIFVTRATAIPLTRATGIFR